MGNYAAKRPDTSRWSAPNIAWAAGLVEGEGCISWRKVPCKNPRLGYKHYPRVLVTSTDKDVLDMLLLILGVGTICGPMQNASGGRPYWTYQIGVAEHAYAVIVAIFPWLRERRKQACEKFVLGFREWTRKHTLVYGEQ